jgi:hypothetical protein
MTTKLIWTVVALMALACVAAADPPGEVPQAAPTDSPKDRSEAFELSIAGATTSLLVTGAGVMGHDHDLALAGLASLLVTPSLGELYANQPFTIGMGVRAASAGAFLVGIGAAVNCDGNSQASGCYLGALWIAGAIGYGAGTVLDIALAGRAVDRYNARRLHARVAPAVIPTAAGPIVGMGIGGRF